ncbi:hypothetical protein [Arthrobacter pigmenti]
MDSSPGKVQRELDRRIEVIHTDEAADPSRRALSAGDLALYVGTTVLICVLGLVVMVL